MSPKTNLFHPMKYWPLYFLISLVVLLPGLYSLFRYGLKLSIDFTGGSIITFSSTQLSPSQITNTLNHLHIQLISLHHHNNLFTLKTSPLTQEAYTQLTNQLKTYDAHLQSHSFSTVGPSLGKELITKTFNALILATCLLLFYIAYRFQNFNFGLAAIIAMLHDALVLLGTFSLLGHFYGIEIDTLFVTALLTILSFSLHDTIIVYDRIRELKKHYPSLSWYQLTNRAFAETMGRSLNNSMTIIFMLLAMYLLGGQTTKNFILALLIGTISGTYSSVFTAAPLLLVIQEKKWRKQKS